MKTKSKKQNFCSIITILIVFLLLSQLAKATDAEHCVYQISTGGDQTISFIVPYVAAKPIEKILIDIDFDPDISGASFDISSPCGSTSSPLQVSVNPSETISCTSGQITIYLQTGASLPADYRLRIINVDVSSTSTETWTFTIHGLPASITTISLDIQSLDNLDNVIVDDPNPAIWTVAYFSPCPAPMVDLATEYDFGNNKKNSPTIVTGSFTIGNLATASADLVITGTSDPPGGRFNWAGGPPSFPIRIPPGGSSATINVQFDTDASPGLKTDDVTFTIGQVDDPPLSDETITLKGTITVPQIRVTYNDNTNVPSVGSTIFTFPETVVGESSTPNPPKSSLKIWNDGDADLVVNSVTTGAPFTPSPSSFSVSPGGFQSVTITFNPPIGSAIGPVTPQNLTIQSDDPDPGDASKSWLLEGTVVKLKIVVCLDLSGSMTFNDDGSLQFSACPETQSRLYLAKQRLKPFFDIIRKNFVDSGEVGLIVFPDPAIHWSVDCSTADPPSSAADMANIDVNHVNNDIKPHFSDISAGGLVAYGDTPLAEGLEESTIRLIPGGAYYKRFLYLITDGAHHCDSSPPFDGTRSHPTDYYLPAGTNYLKNNNITVYTIGMGTSTTTTEYDRTELQNMASNTGGNHYDVDLYTSTALMNALKNELQTSLNLAPLVEPIDSIGVNQSKMHRLHVAMSNSSLTFLLVWEHFQEDLLNFELVTPSCEIINPGVALEHPDMEYISGISYKIYFIDENYLKDPAKIGEWKLIIESDSLIQDPTEIYNYSVLSKSMLQLGAKFDKLTYITGDTIRLEAGLVENGIPLLGAAVNVGVTIPSNTINNWLCANILSQDQMDRFPRVIKGEHLTRGYQKVTALRKILGRKFQLETTPLTLPLYDDGTHGDKNPNDGIYTNYFTETTIPGSYSFNIDAIGRTLSGVTFTRNIVLNHYIDINFSPDSSSIEFIPIDTVNDLTHAKVILRPRDRFGNCLGLDREDEFGMSTTEGKFLSDSITGGPNGEYFNILEFNPNTQNPVVGFDFQGKKKDESFRPIIPPKCFYLVPFAGWFKFDDKLPFKDNQVYGGRIGYTLSKKIEIEVEAGITATDDNTGASGTVLQAGMNVIYNILQKDIFHMQPFATVGAGFLRFSDFYDSDDAFAFNYGGGVRYRIADSRFLIRADFRDYVAFSNDFTSDKTHNLQTTVGIVIRFCL